MHLNVVNIKQSMERKWVFSLVVTMLDQMLLGPTGACLAPAPECSFLLMRPY